jgi:AGZA family xanthine/uracil permease-like MFS transporter
MCECNVDNGSVNVAYTSETCVDMQVSYADALAAVFIEGLLFIMLSITGVRQGLVALFPRTLALSMAAGIGLFLAMVGACASSVPVSHVSHLSLSVFSLYSLPSWPPVWMSTVQ